MKYRMLERCRDAFPLRMMCRCLKVSPSGYYDWRDRPLSARAQANEVLLGRIKELHAESDGVTGAPRIWEDPQYAGVTCGKNRIARLMQAHGIQGIPQRKRWRKKPSGARPVGIQNHLARDFTADESNSKWVTDITYIETPEGWFYPLLRNSNRSERSFISCFPDARPRVTGAVLNPLLADVSPVHAEIQRAQTEQQQCN